MRKAFSATLLQVKVTMAKRSKKFPRNKKALGILPQKAALESTWGRIGKVTSWSGNHLKWRGEYTSPVSGELYTISLQYSLGDTPKVKIPKPKLELVEGCKTLPHYYTKSHTLCLYHPLSGDWTPTMKLSDTTIPWSINWIRYYEMWLLSGGKWFGSEYPHTKKSL